MFKMRFEAIPLTVNLEFLTVRLLVVDPEGGAHNCGLTSMRHEEWAALALRPPISDLVTCEVAVTEGTVTGLLERLFNAAA